MQKQVDSKGIESIHYRPYQVLPARQVHQGDGVHRIGARRGNCNVEHRALFPYEVKSTSPSSLPSCPLTMRLFALSTFLAIIHRINADPSSGSALYPSGLLPLINRANALLSSGQFHDAAKIYSEAIGGALSSL